MPKETVLDYQDFEAALAELRRSAAFHKYLFRLKARKAELEAGLKRMGRSPSKYGDKDFVETLARLDEVDSHLGTPQVVERALERAATPAEPLMDKGG